MDESESSGVTAGSQSRRSSEELLPLVYDELRRLAVYRMKGERENDTLQATALVHEVYLRLTSNGGSSRWTNQRQFFAAAAEAMRRILVDRARGRKRVKRGGDPTKLPLKEEDWITEPEVLLPVHEALTELEAQDPVAAEIVKLRFFVGMTVEETAGITDLSPRTVKRNWAFARAWLQANLEDG